MRASPSTCRRSSARDGAVPDAEDGRGRSSSRVRQRRVPRVRRPASRAPSRRGCGARAAWRTRVRRSGRGRDRHVLHRQLRAHDDARAVDARAGALPAVAAARTTRPAWRSRPEELAAVQERLERDDLTVLAYRFEGDRFCTGAALRRLRGSARRPLRRRVLPDSAANTDAPPFFARRAVPPQRRHRAPDRRGGPADHAPRATRSSTSLSTGFTAWPPRHSTDAHRPTNRQTGTSYDRLRHSPPAGSRAASRDRRVHGAHPQHVRAVRGPLPRARHGARGEGGRLAGARRGDRLPGIAEAGTGGTRPPTRRSHPSVRGTSRATSSSSRVSPTVTTRDHREGDPGRPDFSVKPSRRAGPMTLYDRAGVRTCVRLLRPTRRPAARPERPSWSSARSTPSSSGASQGHRSPRLRAAQVSARAW